MQTYYECPPQTGLVVPAASSKVFAIPYPNKVRFTKLNVVQTTGVAVAFVVALFNHTIPDSPSAGHADDIWRVTDDINSDSPGTLHNRFPDVDVYYVNQDDLVYVQARGGDTTSLVTTTAQRVVYVRITNSGGNDATFSLILGSESF